MYLRAGVLLRRSLVAQQCRSVQLRLSGLAGCASLNVRRPSSGKSLGGRLGAIAIALIVCAFGFVSVSSADFPGNPAKKEKSEVNAEAKVERSVLSFLDEVLDWYRMAKTPPQAPVEPALAIISEAQYKTALEVVRVSFEYARACAAMLPKMPAADALITKVPANPPSGSDTDLSQRKTQVEAEIQALSSRLNELKAQAANASPVAKPAILAQITDTENKLAVDKARLDFYNKVEKFQKGTANPLGTVDGLLEQINDLADSVPELGLGKAAVSAVSTQQSALDSAASSGGIWGRINQLFALQKERSRVQHLLARTIQLQRDFDKTREDLRTRARELLKALEEVENSESAVADPGAMQQRNRQFEAALAELRLLGDAAAPIVAGHSLLKRYQAGLNQYIEGLRQSSYRAIRDLIEQGLLLSVVFGFIFGGAVLWRQLALKYIADHRRLHQVMVFRTITVITVSLMVLVFKFATDMAALATFTGFAAAGIAFALQNVILSLVGYFSIIGRNGARVGDRVGLQGPYGYVYGEVQELGLLRISLRELTGGPDNWVPTGRTIVFPNSVVFTGSFLKLPRASSTIPSKISPNPQQQASAT